MLDLKPCPFCGGEPYFLKPRHENGTAFDTMMIECKHCGAIPYGVSVYNGEKEEDKKAAIAKFWNRRSNGWISVKDRLPEKDGHYSYSVDVFVTDGKKTSIGYYSYPNESWFSYYDDVSAYYISHWLPIPELPEVNKNDEP